MLDPLVASASHDSRKLLLIIANDRARNKEEPLGFGSNEGAKVTLVASFICKYAARTFSRRTVRRGFCCQWKSRIIIQMARKESRSIVGRSRGPLVMQCEVPRLFVAFVARRLTNKLTAHQLLFRHLRLISMGESTSFHRGVSLAPECLCSPLDALYSSTHYAARRRNE